MSRPVSPDAPVAVMERHARARADRIGSAVANHRTAAGRHRTRAAGTQPRVAAWSAELAVTEDQAADRIAPLHLEAVVVADRHADRRTTAEDAAVLVAALLAVDSVDDLTDDQAAAELEVVAVIDVPPKPPPLTATPLAAHAPPGRPLPLYERAGSTLGRNLSPTTGGS